MEEQVKVISLIGEFEGDGNLWFAVDDPETPQRLFDYIMNNVDENEVKEYKIEMVSKKDYETDEPN